MKVKTSVTLSPEAIAAMDAMTRGSHKRSQFIEKAIWEAVRRQRRAERDAHDQAIYAQFEDELNAEALDTLSFQSAWAAASEVDEA